MEVPGTASLMQDWIARANRYRIAAPVRYRQLGQPGWHNGGTVDISRTGVLFHADAVFPAGTPIDVAIDLPPAQGDGARKLVAQAVVVREVPPPALPLPSCLAARLVTYSIS